MGGKHSRGLAMMLLLSAAMSAGCSNRAQTDSENLPAFDSIDEAYDAVDGVLECEEDPVGEPIVPMGDGIPLTTEQRLCAEHVQVDLYPDEEALQESFDIWSDSHQGEVQLARGKNWLVVDVTGAATGEPSPWEIRRIVEELGGEYSVAS